MSVLVNWTRKRLDAMLTPVGGPCGALGPPAAPRAVAAVCSEAGNTPVPERRRNKASAAIPIPEGTGSGPSGPSVRAAATAATDTALDPTPAAATTKFKTKFAVPRAPTRPGLNGHRAQREYNYF